MGLLKSYTRWLHTRWPAGTVEKLPEVNTDGSTRIPGLFVVGDLMGIPLLKFASDSGSRVVQQIVADPKWEKRAVVDDVYDLIIVGAGVAGMAAALEARRHQLKVRILEAAQPFNTIINFPRGKPIFTYPTEMEPAGDLQFTSAADTREGLIEELHRHTSEIAVDAISVDHVERKSGIFRIIPVDDSPPLRAHRVIIAIGRSGEHRRLNVPGEDSANVSNRLHDPREDEGRNIVVVGGGDSALEAAIALVQAGANVSLSYRKKEFSRPKLENIEKIQTLSQNPSADIAVEQPSSERVTTAAGEFNRGGQPGSLNLRLGTQITEIKPGVVSLTNEAGESAEIPADKVYTMIGRKAPLDFFRKSGVPVTGDRTWKWWLSLILVLLAFTFLYHWKKPGVLIPIGDLFADNNWFPYNLPQFMNGVSAKFAEPAHLLGTLNNAMGSPGFFYSLAYCLIMLIFGIRRIKRRRTHYVTVQTWTLIAIQIIPLFFLPYIILPWMGNNGIFDAGPMKWLADQLFPVASWDPNGRAYYHAFGFILAWPLFVWNVFTEQPMWLWLGISFVQTFVIIPLIIWRWGKGAYCGWICSCGGMAETLGDAHRHKMPHGPIWNRLNMLGQVFLAICIFLLITRIGSWIWPESFLNKIYTAVLKGIPLANFTWFIDLLFAGIIGFGLYFHFSGRVWCRFACPLAALMHIYTRFSRFRILAEKNKCISCNVCTSVCHQGIDIMNFANKGVPMEDPECVRCSACVQSCPTGVLSFGRINPKTGETIAVDRLSASPVQLAELTISAQASPN